MTGLRNIADLRRRIRHTQEQLDEVTYISSVDTSGCPGGSTPGHPTEQRAIQRSILEDKLTVLYAELDYELNRAKAITEALPYRQAAAIWARYVDGERVPLASKIEKAYGRRVSRATFYRDLDAAEAAIREMDQEWAAWS